MRLIRKIVAELRHIRSRDVIAEQWTATMRRRRPAPAVASQAWPDASRTRLRHRAGGHITARPTHS